MVDLFKDLNIGLLCSCKDSFEFGKIVEELLALWLLFQVACMLDEQKNSYVVAAASVVVVAVGVAAAVVVVAVAKNILKNVIHMVMQKLVLEQGSDPKDSYIQTGYVLDFDIQRVYVLDFDWDIQM